MQIIERENIDLISPFPVNQVKRLRTWLYCYKSLIIDDSVTMTPDETEEFLIAGLMNPNVTSWGIIDKNNLTTHTPHPAPLVGFISFELNGLYNGYFHVASPRSAWGIGLIEEAGHTVIDWVFTNTNVLRVSAAILRKNYPAKTLCYRLGFKRDGIFEDYVVQNGQPLAVAHFGITRPEWIEMRKQEEECQPLRTLESRSLQLELPLSQEPEPFLDPLLEPSCLESEIAETKEEQPLPLVVPKARTKPARSKIQSPITSPISEKA